MHFKLGIVITTLLAGLPLAFAIDFSHPPVALTGWILFVMSLFGLLGLLQFGLIKYVLKPAIMEEMKGMVTGTDFKLHVIDDKTFQETADDFMDDVRIHMGIERRQHARRKGDPQ
jgi:hypothetical protein